MWLLAEIIFNRLQAAAQQGREATREQALELAAFIGWEAADVYSVEDGVGVIKVVGVLTQEPDPFAAMFGDANTTYSAITDALALAEADAAVETILFSIDSPGGTFRGLLETMEVIRTAKKPTVAQVVGLAASAAYGIAASTDRVEALGRTAQFGSVGVATDVFLGSSRLSITNTGSPNKRPDPNTVTGQAVIRGELDAAFDLFAEGIAAKRNVSARNVAEQYGRGGTFFAEKALTMGMIDTLAYKTQNVNLQRAPSPTGAPFTKTNELTIEAKTMDITKLKAEHPELVALIAAQAIASVDLQGPAKVSSDAAIAKERSRVDAHMHMGTESGDMKTALEAIKSGAEMTPELTSKYLMAAAKKATIDARGADDQDLDVKGDKQVDEAAKDAKAAAGIMGAASKYLNVGA